MLLAGTKEELVQKINSWKAGMEEKGLRVNMGKTEVMRCWNRTCQAENSVKFPCGICKKGVEAHSIPFTVYNLWKNKKCSGIQGRLKDGMNFCCKVCLDRNPPELEVL